MRRRRALQRTLRLTVTACLLAAAAPRAFAAAPDGPNGPSHIAIVAIVNHPTTDALRRGIEDSLRESGMTPGERVRVSYKDAGADLDRAETIAHALLGSDVDLVIALSEPMARVVAAEPLRVPVVVSGIPLAAADAIAASRQAKLLTGVATGEVHRVHMDLIATIRPDARKVLVPWRSVDGTPPAMLRALTAAARTQAFSIVPWRIPDAARGAAVLPATLDNATTVVYLAAPAVGDRADALIRESGKRGIPVVADRRDLVVRGATATIVHDNYAIGRQTGGIAVAILKDPTRARRPIRRAEARFLVVNGEAVGDRRLHLAVRLADIADEVIEWAQPGGANPIAKPAPPARSDPGAL